MQWLIRHIVESYWPEFRKWIALQVDNPNSNIDEALMALIDEIAEDIQELWNNP